MKYLKITNITDSLNKKDKNYNKIFDVNIGGTNVKLIPKLDAVVAIPTIGIELRRLNIEKLIIYTPVSKNEFLKYERLQNEKNKINSVEKPKTYLNNSTKTPTKNASKSITKKE